MEPAETLSHQIWTSSWNQIFHPENHPDHQGLIPQTKKNMVQKMGHAKIQYMWVFPKMGATQQTCFF